VKVAATIDQELCFSNEEAVSDQSGYKLTCWDCWPVIGFQQDLMSVGLLHDAIDAC